MAHVSLIIIILLRLAHVSYRNIFIHKFNSLFPISFMLLAPSNILSVYFLDLNLHDCLSCFVLSQMGPQMGSQMGPQMGPQMQYVPTYSPQLMSNQRLQQLQADRYSHRTSAIGPIRRNSLYVNQQMAAPYAQPLQNYSPQQLYMQNKRAQFINNYQVQVPATYNCFFYNNLKSSSLTITVTKTQSKKYNAFSTALKQC